MHRKAGRTGRRQGIDYKGPKLSRIIYFYSMSTLVCHINHWYFHVLGIVLTFISCNIYNPPEYCELNSFSASIFTIPDPELNTAARILLKPDSSILIFGDTRNDATNFADFYLTNLNHSLDIEWKIYFGDTYNDWGRDAIYTSDGNYFLTGRTEGEGRSKEIYYAKVNGDGGILWENVVGSNWSVTPNAALLLNDGSYLIAGQKDSLFDSDEYIIRIDQFGDTLWSRSFDYRLKDKIEDAVTTNNDNIIALGTSRDFDLDNEEIVITKLNYNGQVIWRKEFGFSHIGLSRPKIINDWNNNLIFGTSVAMDVNSNYTDIQITKINIDGDVLWRHVFDQEGNEYFESLLQTGNDEYVILANGSPCHNGSSDIHLIKVNGSGELKWHRVYGGKQFESAKDVLLVDENKFLIVGHTKTESSGTDFDLIILTVDSLGLPK